MSYLEKIMLVCGDQPAIYKELKFEVMQEDVEESHFRAEIDQHVSVLLTKDNNGNVVGAAIRTCDPLVVKRVMEVVKDSNEQC